MPPDPETHPHAHTIAECKAKYESSYDFSYKYLSAWGGWSKAWINAVGKKHGWVKGKHSVDVSRQVSKKIQDNEAELLADIDADQLKMLKTAGELMKSVFNTLSDKARPQRTVDKKTGEVTMVKGALSYNDSKQLRITIDTVGLSRGLVKDITGQMVKQQDIVINWIRREIEPVPEPPPEPPSDDEEQSGGGDG